VSKALQGFKWTTADARSWHDNTFGPWLVGKTLSVEGAKKGDACGHGIHIGKTATHAISYGKFPGRLFRVEGVGKVLGSDDTKFRVAKCRVLEELEKPTWVSETEAFIESIRTVQWLKPRHAPLKAWQHFPTWDAARAAAWDAAGAAAWDAAWAAAWDAARAAAWAAAWDAAGAAAWDAAWAAAGAAARAAAGDAARAAALERITHDLDYPEKHKRHLRARWDVWKRGYGLVCDVDGVLFTFGETP